MDLNNIAIGTDIEAINRFEGKSTETDLPFLNKIYTQNELDYCFKSKNYAPHLCARFCAKEAIVKALSDFDIHDTYYSDIEILNLDDGRPYAKIKKHPGISIKISMSHCKDYATATAIICK